MAKFQMVRVRVELLEKLRAAAEISGRSVPKELEHRVEKSFAGVGSAESVLLAVLADYAHRNYEAFFRAFHKGDME